MTSGEKAGSGRAPGGNAAPEAAALLAGVSRTLLVTLCGRARGAALFPATGFADPLAEAYVAALGLDAAQYARTPECVFGVVRRSQAIDSLIRRFAREHGAIAVINLGAGLSTTFERLAEPDDCRDILWVDVDLPQAAGLHAALAPSHPGRRMMAADVEQPGWTQGLDLPDRPTLVVAEGLVPYLTAASFGALIDELAARFGDRPLRMVYDGFAFTMEGMARFHASIGPLARADRSIEFRFGARRRADYTAGRRDWQLAALLPVMEGLSPVHTMTCQMFTATFGVPFYAVAAIDHRRT
ncbi:class I SAM-dependent methyltransferase [Pseudoxanthobacter sp.]|uniref:class I SAM-dependent methyltransferase n=1 Tax=Pseudoxanthobacter sp. TaxID=1925742 RepID=UPI002FE08417